ncbi:DUF1073 domain-containing protein [Klebsiella sp. NPDC088457]
MAKRSNRQQKKIEKRLDSYQNVFMNIGTGGDRSAYSKIRFSHLLNRATLDNIYIGDGLGRRIVDIVADEMFRAGFSVEGASDQPKIMSRWDELNLTQHFTDAVAWSRLYGGSLILFGVNDGGDLTSEIGHGELEFVRVYDRYQVQPFLRDVNPESRTYGEVIQYQISPISGTPYYVHASRCHIFDGERLPNQIRHQNQGWGASCLQGIYDALTDFGMSHKHATSLLERKQQGVWSAADLAELCSDGEGREAVQARLNMVDMTRSIGNTIGVDARTEKYELLNGDLSGVTDLQDRKQLRISALTGIDEQILFTKTPTGQGADKTTVPESWKQLIGRKQKDEARPAIEKAVSYLTTDATWTIKFNPLSVPSDKERAETANQWAQADERYSQLGWVSNDEGVATLKARGGYVYPEEDDG